MNWTAGRGSQRTIICLLTGAETGPMGQTPPPTIEDDLYGLGLSIWEIFVGEIPFKDVYMDDILDTDKLGGTVDVCRVEDEEVREVIKKYLRCGGAKI